MVGLIVQAVVFILRAIVWVALTIIQLLWWIVRQIFGATMAMLAGLFMWLANKA